METLEDRRMLKAFIVSDLGDAPVSMAGDAPGTLRQAIFDANDLSGLDTVIFAAGLTGTITLTEGELAVSDSVTISGPGAVQLTIDASGNDPTPGEISLEEVAA